MKSEPFFRHIGIHKTFCVLQLCELCGERQGWIIEVYPTIRPIQPPVLEVIRVRVPGIDSLG